MKKTGKHSQKRKQSKYEEPLAIKGTFDNLLKVIAKTADQKRKKNK